MKIPQKILHSSILIFVIAFSVFCGFKIKDLKFNYDFEAFFPNEDNELGVYETHRTRFEWDNEFVLLGIENKAGIFRKDFLEKIESLSNELKNIPHTDRIISPTNIKNISLSGLAPVQKRLLHIDDETLYKEDSINIYNTPELIGSFFPKDAKSISIFIKTKEGLSKNKSDSLARNIEKAFKKYNFDEVHFVGRIVAQDVYLKNLEKEFVYFLGISFVLVMLFLWLSFRSAYGVIVPMTIVMISIFWTLGIMAMMHQSLDIMTCMLPTMIFIAGMSDVVHFFSKYFEEVARGTEKQKIYPLILKEVGFPTFLTLITTAVGFLSLLFSSIKPIKDFGIYTTVGIVIAFALTYTLLPALLYFFTPKKLVAVHDHNNRTHNVMRKILFWIFRHQKTIIITTCVVVTLSIIGVYKIRVNNILLEDLSDSVRIKQDFMFFDKHYSGVRPLELAVEIKNNKTAWDYEIMRQLNEVDEFLKKEYHAGFMYSPAMLAKNINKALNDETSGEGKFPNEEDYEAIKKQLIGNKKNKDIKRIITPDGKFARINGKISDIGSLKVNELNTHLKDFIHSHLNSKDIEIKITGAAHLIDRNNEYMVTNMTQGFLFSIIVIALLTYFLHRSWRMVLVFILPNFIPLLIIAGIMGFSGIELKAATSLVFSIAFGVATDDTIHFISRLKIELGYGKSLVYAFKRTYFETGKPILLTTFILMGGFVSLMVSDFQSTFYFGFLICITIIIAVIADIFLLPVLLFWILGNKKK
ncbi:MAG: rane protein [Bacteroidetes bacterium]|jgi:predicted RND superfamily exporter protein|nr:rane protein [Bacteroidota bacterium]MDF2453867.1 rane protein [Bacteroidota bacterium]